MVDSKQNTNLTDKQISLLFAELDKDNDGLLSREDLQNALQKAGKVVTKDQVSRMISLVSQTGTLTLQDFSRICVDAKSSDLNRVTDHWLKISTKPADPPVWKVLTAGGVAGAVSRTCTSPLERLKILYQISTMTGPKLGKEGITYKENIFGSLMRMFREEGLSGFFKGNGTNVLRIAPYSAIQFLAFEYYKTSFHGMTFFNGKPTLESLFSGGLAGVTALVMTYPLDLIRTRLTIQTTENKYNGIVDTYKKIVREEGYRALYKGVGTSSLGIAPYGAVNFAVYDFLKRKFIKDRVISVPESLGYGGIAGAVAQTVTYPVDLLRRRMQLQGAGGVEKLYDGPWDAAKQIVKTEGVKGLYRGMIPCYLKVVPAIAISFGTYEMMRQLLGIEQRKTNFGAG